MNAAARRVIRVFPDYGNPWPFWESEAENNTPTASELGLSEESADRSAAAGDRMIEQLRLEVADFADVEDARYRPG